MFRRLFLPALLIVLAGLAAAWWLSRPPRPPALPPRVPTTAPAPPAPGPEPGFAVLFGGELRGRFWVPPCSVIGGGGVARLHAAIRQMVEAGEGVLSTVVATGDVPAGQGEAGELELRTGLLALRDAGLAVTCVGERDLLVGLARWRAALEQEGQGIAVVCANLRDPGGRPLALPWTELTVGTRRVVCTGFLSPSFEEGLREAGVDVRLAPAAESVKAAIAEAGRADLVLLLAHAARAESEEVAAKVGTVDCTITAHAGDLPSTDPATVGGKPFLAAGTRWRNIGRIVFDWEKTGAKVRHYGTRPVGQGIPEYPPVAQSAQWLLDGLRRPGFLEGSLREAAAQWKGGRYAGPASCAGCHASAHVAWRTVEDPHFRSMDAVRDAGLERAPNCLSCHATAPGRPGGHLAPRDAQAAVTCEACHGPADAHVASRGASRLADAKASCAACHVPDMSPDFRYEEAWPRIAHGR